MLFPGGDNLVGELRTAFWRHERTSHTLDAPFLLVVLIPKRRRDDGPVEDVETWVLIAEHTVGQTGVAIGAWELVNGVPGALLRVEPEQDGRNVEVSLAYPFYMTTAEDLARLNGVEAPDDRRITAIGGGSLGSQVMLNAARAAFGRWTVIDEDLLLPHNLARHGLPGGAVLYPKATSVAVIANGLAEDRSDAHGGLVANVLDPGDSAPLVDKALTEADIILDLSASVTVSRALARDVGAPARRVSAYLSPSGTDLTVLAEDAARAVPLDMLEMQVYRAISGRKELTGLLSTSMTRVRYGRSCRDVSVQLPQALVAVHAGIATLAIRKVVDEPGARACVWRVDEGSLAVTAVEIPLETVHECASGDWRIMTDSGLLRQIHGERVRKLPRETGGVLLGTYDFARRIVYIVDTLASPNDSHEYPTSYLRGVDGLTAAVERVEAATAGQVHYIGEWHSHPSGCKCLPSQDDRKLFDWLAAKLAPDGLPPLMLIVGDDGLAVPYLGRIDSSTVYPAEFWLKPVESDEDGL